MASSFDYGCHKKYVYCQIWHAICCIRYIVLHTLQLITHHLQCTYLSFSGICIHVCVFFPTMDFTLWCLLNSLSGWFMFSDIELHVYVSVFPRRSMHVLRMAATCFESTVPLYVNTWSTSSTSLSTCRRSTWWTAYWKTSLSCRYTYQIYNIISIKTLHSTFHTCVRLIRLQQTDSYISLDRRLDIDKHLALLCLG